LSIKKMQKSYNKRLNILIHEIKDLCEKRDEMKDNFNNFLVDGL